jgi:amino-acid N-acetyltransferase
MTAEIRNCESEGKLVGVAGLEVHGVSALLRSVAVFLPTTTAENYFPRFGFSCVGREVVTEAVRGSVEFQGACPSSAVVMRKSLSGDRQ